jgi:hypothetical protein
MVILFVYAVILDVCLECSICALLSPESLLDGNKLVVLAVFVATRHALWAIAKRKQ